MIKSFLIFVLAFCLMWSLMSVGVIAESAAKAAESVQSVTFQYAYDSDSIHEKIDGKLADTSLDTLVYLTIMKNPNYDEKDPNSGEWYIVTLRETPESREAPKK